MTQQLDEQSQQFSKFSEQLRNDTASSVVNQPLASFSLPLSGRKRLIVMNLGLLCILGAGYLFFQSNQSHQTTEQTLEVSVTPTQAIVAQSTTTPAIVTSTATMIPTLSVEPTSKPLATKKTVKPTPTPITGVDLRFVDVFFYPVPEPNKGFTPWRVANGGSITVSNERNVGEFKLSAVLVNYGTEESKNIWVHYFIDGSEVQKGIAYLPGNMVADELVTRDSAQPVKLPNTGTHTIKIVIDPDNQSSDVNTANNTYTFTYSVK